MLELARRAIDRRLKVAAGPGAGASNERLDRRSTRPGRLLERVCFATCHLQSHDPANLSPTPTSCSNCCVARDGREIPLWLGSVPVAQWGRGAYGDKRGIVRMEAAEEHSGAGR